MMDIQDLIFWPSWVGLCVGNNRCLKIVEIAALIPVSEFCDSHTMKKYGVTPDPETLDIVSTLARQKEVIDNFDTFCFVEFDRL